jgi:hypothetical protein
MNTMFSSRGWMRFALLCNLLGAVLLFLSFQATSSRVNLISFPDGRTIFCVNGHTALAFSQNVLGFGGVCPDAENAKPIALVTIEHPKMVTAGFVLTILGFLLQWFSFPLEPKSKPMLPSTQNSN